MAIQKNEGHIIHGPTVVLGKLGERSGCLAPFLIAWSMSGWRADRWDLGQQHQDEDYPLSVTAEPDYNA